jgi:pimeloyl-ACP methyl ester carboxylesterase
MARRAAVIVALAAAGCGGGHHRAATAPTTTPAAAPTERATATPSTTPAPRLTGARPCPEARSLTCSVLRVPLDRSGAILSRPGGSPPLRSGTLRLRVAATGPRRGPVVVLLSGGPGELAIPLLPRFVRLLRTPGIRFVTFDQRGTGRGALRCPALQRQMGSSDLTPPTAAAVRACAARIGPRRRFFATTDTVADLDALRRALHVDRMVLDGVSYGTYVAERYALAHPDNVRGLVLDSVVPHAGVDVFSDVPMRAARRVLRTACDGCPGDPVADLRKEIAAHHDGPQLLDLLTSLSISHPHLRGGIAALHAAARGDRAPLLRLERIVARIVLDTPARELSQGLHASTLCADTPAPWGGPDAPLAGRKAKLDAAAARLPGLGPFDRATATGNGIALQCLYWPPVTEPPIPTAGQLPVVPVLLLAGDEDLSTPLEWARREAALAPRGKLVVVPGAGHSIQVRAVSDKGRDAVTRFLTAPK